MLTIKKEIGLIAKNIQPGKSVLDTTFPNVLLWAQNFKPTKKISENEALKSAQDHYIMLSTSSGNKLKQKIK